MVFKPRESDGANLKRLIEELGGNPAAGPQSEVNANLIKALQNLKRVTDALGNTDADIGGLADVIAEAQGFASPGAVNIGADGNFYYARYNLSGSSAPNTDDNATDGYRVGSIWLYGGAIYYLHKFIGFGAQWVIIYSPAF